MFALEMKRSETVIIKLFGRSVIMEFVNVYKPSRMRREIVWKQYYLSIGIFCNI